MFLSGEVARRSALYAGIALALTSFATMIGSFFLPAALLLIYSGVAARR